MLLQVVQSKEARKTPREMIYREGKPCYVAALSTRSVLGRMLMSFHTSVSQQHQGGFHQWESNLHRDRKDRLVYCVVQHSKWRTSISFGMIALHIAPLELGMSIFFSVLVQYLFLTVLKQVHVVDSLGTVFLPKSHILTGRIQLCLLALS